MNNYYRIKTLQDLNESDLVNSFVVNYEFSPQEVARKPVVKFNSLNMLFVRRRTNGQKAFFT